MDKDLHEKLIKICGGGAGGVFVCACEQKELRDVVSHVITWVRGRVWDVRTVSCIPRRKRSLPLYERPLISVPFTTLFPSMAMLNRTLLIM